jgi:DNA-binding CsgD family transcriptional regulator
MEAVSPDIAKKLLTRDFANLVGRVQKGGKLTRTERAMLQSMATGTGAAPTTAASYVELAAVLGVTRQSVNTWKKRKDAPARTMPDQRCFGPRLHSDHNLPICKRSTEGH